MATIMLDMDECDIAHEALMLEEYFKEVQCVELKPQRTPAISPQEWGNNGRTLRSNVFPLCP
jgi:hypothetical protein